MSKDENNNYSGEKSKKSRWRRFWTKITRRKKAVTETDDSDFVFDAPESEGPNGCMERKKVGNKNSRYDDGINNDTNSKHLRHAQSSESHLNGKSSRKLKKSKKQPKRKPSKEVIPSKEIIVEPQVENAIFDEPVKPQKQPSKEVVVALEASTKTSKKPDALTKLSKEPIKEDELDQSRKVSRRKSTANANKPVDDLSLSKSFQRGFRTFRENRAKEFRSCKTFMSRKYQEKEMEKVVAKVEARQQKRNVFSEPSQEPSSIIAAPGKLHEGDVVFPQRRPNKKSNRQQKDINNNDKVPTKKRHSPPPHPPKTSVNSNGLIETNNCNDGELFLANGKPFWQQSGKGKAGDEEDDEEELSDDELPMNAEIILEVHRGKIKLIDMPTDPVTLYPYGPVNLLESHDKAFFTRDLIFSNTVRSMINLNDDVTERAPVKEPIQRKCNFKFPEKIHRYSRNRPDDFKAESFVPKIVQKK